MKDISSLKSANSSSPKPLPRSEILSSGTPVCVRNTNEREFSFGPVSFSVKPGGAFVTARITADDAGLIEVRDSEGLKVLTVSGGVDVWRKTEDPTHWQKSSSVFLAEGLYTVSGSVENTPMATPQNNLAYLRYEIAAQYDAGPDEDDDKEEEPPTCDPCSCGGSEDGDDVRPPSDKTPGSPEEECAGSIAASGAAASSPSSPASSPAHASARSAADSIATALPILHRDSV